MDAAMDPIMHTMSSYHLIGYHEDTFEKAQERMERTIRAGFMPFAMLYRDEAGTVNKDWKKFQREWLRPAIVAKKFGEVWHKQ